MSADPNLERESMTYDVVIVGAGPAGLAAAIRLRQMAAVQETDLRVCVLEKASDVGAHLLSGAVLDPRALDELLPDWQGREAPLACPVRHDELRLLSKNGSRRLPTPPQMNNAGNHIISVGDLCRWLAGEAEALGVELYPGFPAAALCHGPDGAVTGVITGDQGLTPDGSPGDRYEPGVVLYARQTLLAEGARGSLSEQAIRHFNLRQQPQTYGLGLKELWEVDSDAHRPGTVLHTVGWPLAGEAYGGGFVYHLTHNRVAVGLVTGLDYRNPYLDPFQEFQRFKTHPHLRPLLAGGRRLAYGARALAEGGVQSLPTLAFPGGALLGCAAGFLNVPRVKGLHTAMKSGMVAAEAVFEALAEEDPPVTVAAYPEALRRAWVWPELYRVRNFRPAFRRGLWAGMAWSALETYVFRGRLPVTFRHPRGDHETLVPADKARPIAYPPPDGVVSFDRASSVHLASPFHREDAPNHLRLDDPSVAVTVNLGTYDGPEQRYCPAGVYEFLTDGEGTARLHMHFTDCIHCKTCDIKDPTQNLHWTVPEGGSGPTYANM